MWKMKTKNIIIDNKPYSGIISAKNALIKLGGNWEFEIKEEELIETPK